MGQSLIRMSYRLIGAFMSVCLYEINGNDWMRGDNLTHPVFFFPA